LRRNTEFAGSEQEGFRIGLAFQIITGTNEGVEAIQ
jgi:hypothetical protein